MKYPVITLGLLSAFSTACHDPPTSNACPGADCSCWDVDCPDGATCERGTCVPAEGTGAIDQADDESSGTSGALPSGGDQPCPGCAGDPCDAHDDCLDGFLCARVDDDTALCTNCALSELNPLLTGDCDEACTADVQCGDGGTCQGGVCFHACGTVEDCPAGYVCQDDVACLPDDLPELGEPCASTGGYLCAPDPEEDRLCLFVSEDAGPLDSWCSKPCTSDVDCIDTWTNGCCADVTDADGGVSQWCTPAEWSQFCAAATMLCEDSCAFAFDGVCDDGGAGSAYSVCDYGTDCGDCGPRGA